MTESIVRSGVFQVSQRLADLGLTEEVLVDAALTGQRYAADCTALDAPSAAGFFRWAKTIRTLREQLVVEGWESWDDRGFPEIVHPAREHAISCAGGNSYTGRPDRNPGTKSAKGPVVRDAVAVNMQASFRDLDTSFDWPTLDSSEPPLWRTWLLLMYWDQVDDELRLELSLPSRVDRDGFVNAWVERLILSPVTLRPVSGEDFATAGDPINVEVDLRDDQLG